MMESFDNSLMSALRDFEVGMQQAIYYAVFVDIFILISIGLIVWSCCAFLHTYKKYVDESIRIKRSEKQYFLAKAERERLEALKLKYELGLQESINKEIGI